MADEKSTGSGGGNGGITGVASKTVGALSGFPMLLVLAILNVATLGMVTYLTMKAGEYRAQERTQLIELLRNCVVKHLERDGGVKYETPGWNNENTQKANQKTP